MTNVEVMAKHEYRITNQTRYPDSGFGQNINIYDFFFSSRRRHTRLQGDWSSDVCSSDLEDTLHAQIHKDSHHANPQPLYTPEDVDPALKLFKSMPRSGGFDISPEFHVVSYDAGHILGSSSLE